MNQLVPIFICAIMPIAIVLISALTKMNQDKQRTQVIIKAIESNNNIDADKLAESFKKPAKSPVEILNLRLLRGCIFTLLGIGLYAAGYLAWANGCEFSEDQVSIPVIFGSASTAVGISYLIVWAVTRKQVKSDNDSKK